MGLWTSGEAVWMETLVNDAEHLWTAAAQLLRAQQARLVPLRERQVVGGVLAPHGFGLAAGRELLQRVLADRLEHPQARLAVGRLLLAEQAVVDQGGQPIQQVQLEVAARVAHVWYACAAAGLVVVPIYPTLTAEQTRYILDDSGARVAIVSNSEQAKKIERLPVIEMPGKVPSNWIDDCPSHGAPL